MWKMEWVPTLRNGGSTILSLRERVIVYVFNILFIADWRKRCIINRGM